MIQDPGGPGTRDLNTVILIPSGANAFGLPKLSTNQIVCGPTCKTAQENGRYVMMQSPNGHFDITTLLGVLPPEQAPEAIIVWADSSNTMLPLNLQAYGCPKILMVGDSHHLSMPLQTMLIYAATSPFDRIIVAFRQHAHFFVEAGFRNVHWLQGPMTTPIPRPFEEDRVGVIALLGSLGDLHPYRARVLAALERKNCYSMQIGNYAYASAMEIYGRSQISLNVSLNGDMNYRPFEVMGAGGFLITDKLSSFSGLDTLFEEGHHYVDYTSIDELLYKIDYYANNPTDCLEIARRGQQKYLTDYSRDSITGRLWNIVFDNVSDPVFAIDNDIRPVTRYQNGAFILPRVAIYETVQEQHRVNYNTSVLFLETTNLLSLFDCADLPRCSFSLISADGMKNPLLDDLAQHIRIEYLTVEAARTRKWDTIVGAPDTTPRIIADSYDTDAIIISGLPFKEIKEPMTAECPAGFIPSPAGYAIFERYKLTSYSSLQKQFATDAVALHEISLLVGIREKRVLQIGPAFPDKLISGTGGMAENWLAADCLPAEKPSEPFDLVYVSKANERLPDFTYSLAWIYDALRPGGQAFLTVSLPWAAYEGIDIAATAKNAEISGFEEGNIMPRWAHLMIGEAEFEKNLLTRTDAQSAAKLTRLVYDAPDTMRSFINNYTSHCITIPFAVHKMFLSQNLAILAETEAALQEKTDPAANELPSSQLILILKK